MSGSPDYGKLSLYLGVLSVIGGAGYWYWQFKKAEGEARFERKYHEVKKAIAEVQASFGLQPTGKLDPTTRELLLGLSRERLPAGLPTEAG
jgi:hypothetical protein